MIPQEKSNLLVFIVHRLNEKILNDAILTLLAGSRITPSPSASVVSSQQLPQSQGIGQPVPIALHHAGDIQTSVTVSSNNSQPISVPTTSVKKPGLKVVIPERPPAVGQVSALFQNIVKALKPCTPCPRG